VTDAQLLLPMPELHEPQPALERPALPPLAQLAGRDLSRFPLCVVLVLRRAAAQGYRVQVKLAPPWPGATVLVPRDERHQAVRDMLTGAGFRCWQARPPRYEYVLPRPR
jgi:hypothetical protein